MHKMPATIRGVRSRLPTAPIEKQHPSQNINRTFPITPKKKTVALFSDSIPRGMNIKHLNSHVKEGKRKNTLKSNP